MNKTYRFEIIDTSSIKKTVLREAMITIPEEIVFSNYMPLKEYQSYVAVCPFSKRLQSVFKNFPRAATYKIFDYLVVDLRGVCALDELPTEELETLNERFRQQISDVYFRQIIPKRELKDATYDFGRMFYKISDANGKVLFEMDPDIQQQLKELAKDPYVTMSIAKFREFMKFGDSLQIKFMSVNFCDPVYNNPVDSITPHEEKACNFFMYIYPSQRPFGYDDAVEITKSLEVKEMFEKRKSELLAYL